MSLTQTHIRLLADGISAVLGKGNRGDVAFVRCLPGEVIYALASTRGVEFANWQVWLVAGDSNANERRIPADKAVELRESKGEPLLFLVDLEAVGAGMDGIYSAARELTEEVLFKTLHRRARRQIDKDVRERAQAAVSLARKMGERNTVSAWREFEFLAACAESESSVGRSLPCIGLWPADAGALSSDGGLEVSCRMVERLLLGLGSGRTIAARVDALMLEDASELQKRELEQFLQKAQGLPTLDAVARLRDLPSLWLGQLKPTFAGQNLRRVDLRSWRTTTGRLAKWSGLTDQGEELPHFVVNLDAPSSAQYSKLEVRWDTDPADIAEGTVDYRVSLMAGEDELAYHEVPHSARQPQVVKFTTEDFQDVDEDAKYEARVRVLAIGQDSVEPCHSEDFILKYGTPPDKANVGTGTTIRALSEGAIYTNDIEEFRRACGDPSRFTEDRRGFISFRPHGARGRSFRVQRPSLLRDIESIWISTGAVGRWSIRVRSDGTPVTQPQFHAADFGACTSEVSERVNKIMRRLCEETAGFGLLGLVHTDAGRMAEEYVVAWASALEQGPPSLALANTVEVQSLSGRSIGIIVLPHHPVRMAWQMAYDRLAAHAKFECGMNPPEIQKVLSALDSSHFPALLPGLEPGTSFVFGDTLGLAGIAMVRDDDAEPKAAIAQLVTCFCGMTNDFAPAVGERTSLVLANELTKYVQFHSLTNVLHVHALRPGDGSTVSKALGRTLDQLSGTDREEESGPDLCFSLDLYPANAGSDVTGRFISDVVERRRSGATGIATEDRWFLENVSRPGGILIPRLRWAKRPETVPSRSAHVSIAFDTFASRVAPVASAQVSVARPLHGFGLIAHIERNCTFDDGPNWRAYLPPIVEGEKHPAGRQYTDRLLRLQKAVLGCVTRHLGAPDDHWPTLHTRLSAENQEAIGTLHRLSDWVVTVDRNVGIEFFDSPRNAPTVYDAYVIDCVPERDDLGSLQLITSTSQTAEVRSLLDETLAMMGLSSSLRNCEFLLWHLKSLSGRLAIRLVSPTTKSGELIALALVHANCIDEENANSDMWLRGADGFFVPLDDVRDLLPPTKEPTAPNTSVRADLLFVTAASRTGLQFAFVEVKYRRHLRTARDPALIMAAAEQASGTAVRWKDYYFSENHSEITRALRRSRLARVLRFYAEKARRHRLTAETFDRLAKEIDKLLSQGGDFKVSTEVAPHRVYVFCPEADEVALVEAPQGQDDVRVVIFGPGRLPDLATRSLPPGLPPRTPDGLAPGEGDAVVKEPPLVPKSPEGGGNAEIVAFEEPVSSIELKSDAPEPAQIVLGHRPVDDSLVKWEVSLAANPHLMIAGLPGMGKTTCLINICKQLHQQNITPVVFSFHEDIDAKLVGILGDVRMLEHDQLGFNPMQVDATSRNAHIDSAGMLRDIFAAIFPDFGDIQTERIRQAIKESYTRLGWGGGEPASPHPIPAFRDFFSILQHDPKPDRGLMARLTELDDYGVFASTGESRNLLNLATPIVFRIHATQNEVVQRAFASLILFSLYQEMFRRGVQRRITHAVILDEAHRASRLKLLPTMAKECRKYGIALILASQEAKDFDASLYSAVANYLVLRLTEHDAKALAKNVTVSDMERRTADTLKTLDKYHGLFFCEGKRRPAHIVLSDGA